MLKHEYRWAMGLCAVLALAAAAGCSDRASRQAVDPRVADATRPLVLLTYPTEPPCSYGDGDGNIVGTDFGIATIIMTDARRRDVDFSAPYATGGACFLYRKAGRKPRMSRISVLRIGVEADSVHDLYLCFHGCDPKRFVSLKDAIDALERDVVDAVFFDSVQLKAKAEASGGRLLVTPLETKDLYGVAVDKRRPDVLAAANAVIAEGGAK